MSRQSLFGTLSLIPKILGTSFVILFVTIAIEDSATMPYGFNILAAAALIPILWICLNAVRQSSPSSGWTAFFIVPFVATEIILLTRPLWVNLGLLTLVAAMFLLIPPLMTYIDYDPRDQFWRQTTSVVLPVAAIVCAILAVAYFQHDQPSLALLALSATISFGFALVAELRIGFGLLLWNLGISATVLVLTLFGSQLNPFLVQVVAIVNLAAQAGLVGFNLTLIHDPFNTASYSQMVPLCLVVAGFGGQLMLAMDMNPDPTKSPLWTMIIYTGCFVLAFQSGHSFLKNLQHEAFPLLDLVGTLRLVGTAMCLLACFLVLTGEPLMTTITPGFFWLLLLIPYGLVAYEIASRLMSATIKHQVNDH